MKFVYYLILTIQYNTVIIITINYLKKNNYDNEPRAFILYLH
jgi:hypothetical protein